MRAVLAFVALFAIASNAQLWGVTPQNQLISLDAEDGLWTLAGAAFADRHITTLIQVADVDESASTFYVAAINKTDSSVGLELIGLSIQTGQIVSETFLPFRFSFNYVDTPGVDYIPGTHDVLVYGANVDGENYNIYRITPSTGKIVEVTTWPKTGAVIQSVDAFDAANNILWIQLEQNNMVANLGFDINSGDLMFNSTDTYGMQALNYDSNRKQTVGIAQPVNGKTPLVALNGATGAYTQIATLDGEFIIAGPDNAGLDIANRQLYQYADNGATVELLVVNIDQGTISTVAFSSGSSVLPTTVAFFN